MDRSGDDYRVTIGGRAYSLRLKPGPEPGKLVVEMFGKPLPLRVAEVSGRRVELSLEGEPMAFQRTSPSSSPASLQPQTQTEVGAGVLASPMPGRVISLLAKEGKEVRAGEPLVVIESMKMEVAVRSDRDGVIERVVVTEGAPVKRGQALVRFRD